VIDNHGFLPEMSFSGHPDQILLMPDFKKPIKVMMGKKEFLPHA
jgi:hypothetical protein